MLASYSPWIHHFVNHSKPHEMKRIILLLFCASFYQNLSGQCWVDMDPNGIYPICYTWWGAHSAQLAPWAVEEPGWTYSWSPIIGLDNPNILQPMANPSTTTTYTLTVTAPGCGTFIAGTAKVEIMPNTPAITPAGPITRHYSDTSKLILTSTAPYGGWYKNGTLVQGCCNANYTVNFTPSNSNYTDYYRYFSPYSCNYWSNTIEVSYIGCGICKVTIVNNQDGSPVSDNEKIKAMKELENIQISPNPATSYVKITTQAPVNEVEIINMAGAVVKKIRANGNIPCSFNVDNLPNGYYICSIKMASGIKQLPFIIRR